MSGLVLTSSGYNPPGGAIIDLLMGFWDPVTNLTNPGSVALADGDTFTDGMYWICSDSFDRDLGSGSIHWSRDDQVYRGQVTTGVYAIRDIGPYLPYVVLTAGGGIVNTAQGNPVYI